MAVAFDNGIFSVEDVAGAVLAAAKLYFYTTGTSTPLATYSDQALSIPNSNPVVAGADGRFGPIWLQNADYKVVLKTAADVTLVTRDPVKGGTEVPTSVTTIAAMKALVKAALVNNQTIEVGGYTSIGDGGGGTFYWNSASTATTNLGTCFASNEGGAGRWLRVINGPYDVKWFGAVGDGVTNDTAAIQAAIDTGARMIFFPAADYSHGNLTLSTTYQRLSGPGAKLVRATAGTTITVNARGVHFDQMRFGCVSSGLSGNNITVTAPDFRATNCESRDCAGRALLVANAGGGIIVNGGVYQTTDATSSGYDIEIRDDAGGGNTLYSFISNIITNQAQGGILITGEVGSMAIDNCQFGKLRMDSGGSSKVSNCRINGTTTILSGFGAFVQNDLNGNVVFGTSGGSNIGSIRFDSTNTLTASASLTIENNVIESTFHLGQIISTGSTVTINSYNNDIWHPEMTVSLTLGAESGSPTFGNGTVVTKMSAAGRQRFLSVDFTLGTTSNMGGGAYFYIVAPFIAKSSVTGTAYVLDSGTGHFDLTVRQLASSNQIFFFPSSGGTTAVSSGAAFNNPMTWATGDRLIFSLNAEQTF